MSQNILKSLKSATKNAGNWVSESIKKPVKSATKNVKNEFVNWIRRIIPDVPEPIKEPVNETLEMLEQQVSDIYKKWDSQSFKIRESDSALKGFAKRYVIDGREGYDPKSFMKEVKSQVVDLLNKSRQNKVYLALKCVMEKRDMSTGEVVTAEPTFRSDVEAIIDETDVNEIYKKAVDKMMESMANFQGMGSNWQFRSVKNLDINTTVYKPLRGNSYICLLYTSPSPRDS